MRQAISLLAACLLGFALARTAVGQDSLPALVERAARPEIMFGRPEEFDSLLVRITADGKNSARELLDMSGTPWAWRFEVIRRALERMGDTARQAILERLSGDNPKASEMSRLLVLFEKLGREGDESALDQYLRAESPVVTVPALRCLAAFGMPERSLKTIMPLLGSGDPHLRLAAVWALGEQSRRGPLAKAEAARLRDAVRPLLDNQELQIRLTATETLRALGSAPAPTLLRRD